MKRFKSETELAEIIVEYLKEMGWEVYQEVQISSFGSIADIVAIQGNLIWILECKLSLSMSLLAQAEHWINYAHYVSIVVPSKRSNNKTYYLLKGILNHFGIGCYKIGDYGTTISEFNAPKLNRKAHTDIIRRYLTDKQKNYAKAGNAEGRRYTPFQDTKDQLIRIVKDNPGITMKEIIKDINHHYSTDATAKSSLLQWIHKGIIEEIELKKEGKIYKFYLKENEK